MTIIDYRELKDQDGNETGIVELKVKTWRGKERIYTGSILGFYDLATGKKWPAGSKKFKDFVMVESLREKLAEINKPVIKAVD
jgi:hypothetical protein